MGSERRGLDGDLGLGRWGGVGLDLAGVMLVSFFNFLYSHPRRKAPKKQNILAKNWIEQVDSQN
jgi:hypothetical protein